MPSALMCVVCTLGDDVVEFPTIMELKKHEMLGHTTRWEKPLAPDPRGEHLSATELKEGKTKAQESPKESSPEPEVEKPPLPEPLILKYKWEGQCPDCRDKVKTIEVEVDRHSLIVAYCVRDDKKLAQESVTPLGNRSGNKLHESSDKANNTFEHHLKPRKKS